jgi:hypothetical protein
MVELSLANLPRESDNRNIPNKYYILRPRSARSKVKGHLQLYHAYIKEDNNEDGDADADEDVTVEDVDTPTPSDGSAVAAGTARSGPSRQLSTITGGVDGDGNGDAPPAGDDWEIVGIAEQPSPPMATEERPATIEESAGARISVFQVTYRMDPLNICPCIPS